MSASLHQKSGLLAVLLLLASTIGFASAEPAPSAPAPSATAPAANPAPPSAPAPSASLASPSPPATAEPPAEGAPQVPPSAGADAKAPANVIVLVFVGGAPAPDGYTVTTNTGVTAVTTADGVARFALSAGAHDLTLTVPAGALPNQTEPQQVSLGTFRADAGGSVQVLANLDETGEVTSVDMEGQAEGTDEAETEAEAAPEAEVVLGTITGRIISDDKKEPIVDALVLVPGVETEVRTDAQGRFRIEVPVGTQSVSAIHSQFSTQTQRDIEVKANEATEVVLELTPVAAQLDDVVITAPHIKGSVAGEISKRRKSLAVQDSLGAADLAKTGDGSASSASKRIVGASIVGGQFLFVRGLGGRYSNVRLNGVPLPSTDPDLPGFQLDLFPTSLLSSLTIAKTFTPDIPGDFAGGSMNIETKAFPEEFTLTLSASTSYNTETTGRDILGSQGGSTDYLGTDDGGRAIPDEVSEQRVATCPGRRGREAPEGCLTAEDIEELSQFFPNTWKLMHQTAFPNLGLGASVGNTFDLGSAGKLGFLVTGGYKYGYERYKQKVSAVSIQGTGEDRAIRARETVSTEIGEEEALMGGLATVGYSPVENHTLAVVALLTQNGVDSTTLLSGRSEEDGTLLERRNFSFVERSLRFNQLLGQHDQLADFLDIGWQVNTATIERNQPDSRDVVYTQLPSGDFRYRGDVGGSGERLYATLEQTDYGGGLDLTFHLFDDAQAKTGYMGRTSERSFSARRFKHSPGSTTEAVAGLILPAEEYFDPENSPTLWTISEQTKETDGFDATQDLHAGYAMLSLPVLSWLKATGGVRVEHFDQRIQAGTPFSRTPATMVAEEPTDGEGGTKLRGENKNTDLLPAGGLIFALTQDMNVRAAYGGTVGRPQIKELAPFVTDDYVRRRSIKGNPDLNRTFIHNFDLRWEMFPVPTQVFAVSLFYKLFEDPIEGVLLDQNGNITFENIAGANNYGIELEARLGLDIVTDTLSDFSILSNVAFIRSEVRLTEEQQRVSTSKERALAGQSPYVANLGFGWEPEDVGLSAFVFYNVFGRRISDVGRQGLPDEYEEAFHSVEANINWEPFEHFSLGVSGSNLLLAKERYTQGGITTLERFKGATFSLGAGFKY